MKKAIVVCMFLLSLFGCGRDSSTGESAAIDSISIINISPSSAVAGTNTSFAVEVFYSLSSRDSGLLTVGFNSSAADSFNLVSSQTWTVAKGSGIHTFTASATPVDWGPSGTFQVLVNLSENPHSSPWTPLASDFKTISLH